MRVTIIREDGYVSIDGRGIVVDLSDMPDDLHAVQWYGEDGHVERQGLMNQSIDSIADFQAWIDRAAAEIAAQDAVQTAVPTLENGTTAFIKRIDADADKIYQAAVGNRVTEYMQAEADAQAYKDSGYAGTAPQSVQSWADACAKSAQWAADDTLETATAWRMAQTAIRENRLGCKGAARRATTLAELDVVAAQWAAFKSAICVQLGVTL